MFVGAIEGAGLQTKKSMVIRVPAYFAGLDAPVPSTRPRGLQCQGELLFAFAQGDRLLLDPAKHLVKGVGQESKFIASKLRSACRKIATLGNVASSFGEGENGSGNTLLESIRENQGDQNRAKQHQAHHAGINT